MHNTPRKFEPVEHTADAGIRVYGSTLAELFENAALGMFDMIADLRKVDLKTSRQVHVEADDREMLLVNWLSELNYLFQVHRELYKKFVMKQVTATTADAEIFGEAIDPGRHEIHTDLKAVTFHELFIKETAEGWVAQVIFDL